eukprot:1182041-Prorocentrum_minimum.AAC.2
MSPGESPAGGTKRVTLRGTLAAREAAAEVVMGKVATFLRHGCPPVPLASACEDKSTSSMCVFSPILHPFSCLEN